MRSGLVILGAAFWMGCGADVVVVGHAPDGEAPCIPVAVDQPELELSVLGRGTHVGDWLYLDALVDGERRQVIAQVGGGDLFVASLREDLVGSAHWVDVGASRYARIEDGVEVIDAGAAAEPVSLAVHPLVGSLDERWSDARTASEGHVFLCLDHGDGGVLTSMDLSDPLSPGEPRVFPAWACNADVFDDGTAGGAMLASWKAGEGAEVSQVAAHTLSPDGPEKIADWGFSPSGAHGYGRASGGATDGERAVFDTVTRWMLVFPYPESGPYLSFPLAGEKRLLTVTDGVAYFATEEGVVGIDVSDAQDAQLLAPRGDTGLAPSETHFVAADARHVVVRDDAGRLYVVPRDRSAVVTPSRAYLGPAPEPQCL